MKLRPILLAPFLLAACMTDGSRDGNAAIAQGIYQARLEDACENFIVEYWFRNDTNVIVTHFGYRFRKADCEDTAADHRTDSILTMIHLESYAYAFKGGEMVLPKGMGMLNNRPKPYDLRKAGDMAELKQYMALIEDDQPEPATLPNRKIRNVGPASFELYMQFGWDPDTGLDAMQWVRFAKVDKRIL
jgi:hypothetical protein